jgi:hypothetical protein
MTMANLPPGVNSSGGKFYPGVNYNGANFASGNAGVVDNSGKFTTGVNRKFAASVNDIGRKIKYFIVYRYR